MKRLLAIVIVIGIAAYIFFQVWKDRRFNSPSGYDFQISQNIDTDFYDPDVLKDYYGTVLEIGTFARSMWRTYSIDVEYSDYESPDDQLKVNYYLALKKSANLLQDKLEESQRLKTEGYNKKEIELLMEKGMTREELKLWEKSYLVGLKVGSNGSPVWELQKMLNAKGDSIPEDGIFNLITINRLKEFQTTNNLFPSGELDKNTLKALLK